MSRLWSRREIGLAGGLALLLISCSDSDAQLHRTQATDAIVDYDRALLTRIIATASAGAAADSLIDVIAASATANAASEGARRWIDRLGDLELAPLARSDVAWIRLLEVASDSLVLRAGHHVRASGERIEEAHEIARQDIEAFHNLAQEEGRVDVLLTRFRANPTVLESLQGSLRALSVLMVLTSRENDLVRAGLEG